MNKIVTKILIILLLNIGLTNTYAEEVSGNQIFIGNYIEQKTTIKDIFNFYASFYSSKVPESYKYIKVNYKDIEKGSEIENSLKILIYLDLIKNPSILLKADSELNAWNFYRLSEKILGIQIDDKETKNALKERNTTENDLNIVSYIVGSNVINIDSKGKNSIVKVKNEVFNEVFNTILNGHYDKDKLDEGKLLESAISGIALGTNDKHTVYFNKIEGDNFKDSLSNNYEGIGSYVDMEQPGMVKIVSPIPDSPSEKAGLKGGDIIKKVDEKEVTKDNSLNEVISWIKGPAGTKVLLTIDRNGEILEITVTRDKIIIVNIESKVIDSNTYYIQIKTFGEEVKYDFKESLLKLKEEKNINKIIIDLRNNGGGILSEVSDILSYFVPEGEPIAREKLYNGEEILRSYGYDLIDFSKYKIVILQNSGTASASEILIGTLRDYYPNITLIGENTYGKGSVQAMQNLYDGGLLKYTIAKWFTGKTQTGIDGVGIKPDIELELDIESYNKDGTDNQLNEALKTN